MAEERVVLVTGASSGIGLETAWLLSREGLRVFGTHLPGEEIGESSFETLELDVNSEESVAACVAGLVQRAGRLDVLHNNAGFGLVGMVEETPVEQCRAMFETNYLGTVRMIRAALPVMREQRSGLIINTSSVAAYIGVPFEAHYCASKYAVASLTQALRYEVAPFGIEVVAVVPGYVRTPFYKVMRRAEPMTAYDGVRERAIASFDESAAGGSDAPDIARRIVRVILSTKHRPRYWVGRDAVLYGLLHRFLPDVLGDWVLRRKFAPR